MIYIIGAGGVGSWLAPSICLLKGVQNVVVVDGDTLEQGNLNRQLFTSEEIGRNKADALAMKYGCDSISQWYSMGLVQHTRQDWLLVCVDNNAGRRSVLAACDRFRCNAIFAANETTSSEAYLYLPKWKDEETHDPRKYYPDILTDHSNDPMARAMGCTGVAQEQNTQLVSANFTAAALAQHLFVLWNMHVPKLEAEIVPRLPFRLKANLSRLEQLNVGEL